MPRGLRSDEHLAQRRVFIVSYPRTPSYGGRLPQGLIMASRRAKTRSVILFASGLRPFMCKIWWKGALK